MSEYLSSDVPHQMQQLTPLSRYTTIHQPGQREVKILSCVAQSAIKVPHESHVIHTFIGSISATETFFNPPVFKVPSNDVRDSDKDILFELLDIVFKL